MSIRVKPKKRKNFWVAYIDFFSFIVNYETYVIVVYIGYIDFSCLSLNAPEFEPLTSDKGIPGFA